MEQKGLVEMLNKFPRDRDSLWKSLRKKSPGALVPVLIRARDQRLPLFGYLLEDLPRGWRILVPLESYRIVGVRKTAKVFKIPPQDGKILERAQKIFAAKMSRVSGEILESEEENVRPLAEGIRRSQDPQGGSGEIPDPRPGENHLGRDKAGGEP